jgi:hypothetical protein
VTSDERLMQAKARATALAVCEAAIAQGRLESTPAIHDAMSGLAFATALDLDLGAAA